MHQDLRFPPYSTFRSPLPLSIPKKFHCLFGLALLSLRKTSMCLLKSRLYPSKTDPLRLSTLLNFSRRYITLSRKGFPNKKSIVCNVRQMYSPSTLSTIIYLKHLYQVLREQLFINPNRDRFDNDLRVHKGCYYPKQFTQKQFVFTLLHITDLSLQATSSYTMTPPFFQKPIFIIDVCFYIEMTTKNLHLRGTGFLPAKRCLFPSCRRFFSHYNFWQKIGYQTLFKYLLHSNMQIMQSLRHGQRINICHALSCSELLCFQERLLWRHWNCTKIMSQLF